jgi:hypothetical protein
MRAVFLNQRNLLIIRGARCTLPHGSARKPRPAAGGGLATVAGVRQGGRRPYCGEFGLRVGRPRLREYGTDFVVDRCQHSCGAAVRGRGAMRCWMLAARKG